MRKLVIALCAVLVLGVGVPTVSADVITLSDWSFSLNGTPYNPPALPGSFNTSLFDFVTGLGTITATFSTSGPYSLLSFFDHEVTGLTNPLDDEYGYKFGSAPAGLSWEIDEPGWGLYDASIPPNLLYTGDLVSNFVAGTLDNTVLTSLPGPALWTGASDIAMGLGWSFVLDSGKTAVVTFLVGPTAPSGFYLNQRDLAAPTNLYFSSNLDIHDTGTPPIPEPGTMLLLGSGLVGVVRWRRRKK